MKRRLLVLAFSASLTPVLGGCHVYYFAHARVTLSAPADTSCLRSTLTEAGRYALLSSQRFADGRSTVVSYGTPSMFHKQWDVVTQVVHRDSSVHLGQVYRDSSAVLAAGYVQLDRRIEPSQGVLLTAQMANFLLDARDACGGRSPNDERLFSVGVTETPYQAWVVRGTEGRLAMRLTVDSRRYRLHWPTHPGRHVLRADTLATGSGSRQTRWLEIDSLELPPPSPGTTLAIHCWRGDSLPSGGLVAIARTADSRYLGEVVAAWGLDRSALRIRPVPVDGIECLNPDWGSLLPDAPRALRAAALTFRPSAGMARIYAYLSEPNYADERAIPSIAVDSQLVGRLVGGSFLMVEVEPGRHRVSAPAGSHESSVWLDAARDSSYFVELKTDEFALSFRWRAKASVMDPAKARDAIRRAHMVSSSWPGPPMRTSW